MNICCGNGYPLYVEDFPASSIFSFFPDEPSFFLVATPIFPSLVERGRPLSRFLDFSTPVFQAAGKLWKGWRRRFAIAMCFPFHYFPFLFDRIFARVSSPDIVPRLTVAVSIIIKNIFYSSSGNPIHGSGGVELKVVIFSVWLCCDMFSICCRLLFLVHCWQKRAFSPYRITVNDDEKLFIYPFLCRENFELEKC